MTMLTPTMTRITPKRTTMRGTAGGRTVVVAVAATATNQRICPPAPPFFLNDMGGAVVVVFVSKANQQSTKADKRKISRWITAAMGCAEKEAPAANDKSIDIEGSGKDN